MSTDRRRFIKFVVAGSIAAGCPIDPALLAAEATAAVDGEENRICHEVRDGKVFSRPPVTARHEVVIVGGGMSGLAAAHLLRHHDFLLLEKEPHWGGNAYVMEYEGQAYATGAAFLDKSEPAYQFAKDLGLEPLPIDNWDGSIIKGEFIPDTWGEGLDHLPYPAAVREGFKKFRRDMLAIDLKSRGPELFNLSFAKFLEGYPEEIRLWWDAYGPSNWGARSEQTAATIPIYELQSLAGDDRHDSRCTWPGGLGALSARLAQILQKGFASHLQTGATIVAVVPGKNEVEVTYVRGPELKTVAAKAVIMATPKFITRRLIDGLPSRQSEAMHQIHYIPYPVVNLIFDKPVFNKGYDTWCPGNAFTDFIVADWVVRKQSGYRQKHNILTFYTPLDQSQRGLLLSEESTRSVAAGVLRDFQKLFPGSSVDPVEVHIYRRGHPLYMSTAGLYTNVQPEVRQPMDRIFFANTDSEGPVSATGAAIAAASRAAGELEARLAGRPAVTP